jgi:predicted molibdopterin-dependent oxidoreductase YjgC
MFARLPDVTAAAVAITIDGVAFAARDGDAVAAALLAAGTVVCRTTPVAGAPRGPFCMMGACFDCLVEVDGCPNVRSCMTRVAPGMRIVTRRAERRV